MGRSIPIVLLSCLRFSLITTPTMAKLISYHENLRVPGQAVAAAYFIHSTAQFLGIILSLTQKIIQLNLT
ncbi:hypothetical protein [Coxiella-like endosymbiont of Rhipicephalus sanguineus]|uniref:hypothetical protein n=1 Tax=Coxiella-like endosymbiont of Rhipicephalus sanguineus TaxID=1955402 RepID=UPI00203EF83D|nr:hypothetical protein [Coxiella-like endosymbiont of Rhipicephalus sanguineus]